MFSVMRTIGDHAVLQSGVDNRIFGKAEQRVTLTVSDGASSAVYSAEPADGRWEITLPPYKASFKPYTFTFVSGKESISCGDILFGDLFHISGQSNMELPLSRTVAPIDPHMPKENSFIREYRMTVTNCFDADAEYDDFLDGRWTVAEGEEMMHMSAAGHYFAQELFGKYDIPIGLVNTAAGGAPVESRMPCAMLRSFGGYDDFLDKCTKPGYMEDTAKEDAENFSKWIDGLVKKDTISDGIFKDTDGFSECSIPFDFSDIPELSGMSGWVWFVRHFEIPEGMSLDDAVLILGTMVDSDVVYVNGEKVGETGYLYPPRIYRIPAGVLHTGDNTVHIRLEVHGGEGRFTPGKRYCLKLGDDIIDLSGKWGYKVAATADPLTPGVFFQGLPLSMYAAMTAPAFNIRFKGLIWYQAESNGNYDRYTMLFREFVEMYRRRSGYDIPVVFAQLPNFADITPGLWPNIREAQRKCLDIPGTAMSVTIDAGESHDLHPLNKWDVGKRLAYAAERLIYGDDTAPVGAEPISAEHTDGGVLVRFNVSGIEIRSDAPCFTVTDGERSTDASAQITADGVLLRYDGITPVKVRYLWENDPTAVLYYKELPVTPFEMDIKMRKDNALLQR